MKRSLFIITLLAQVMCYGVDKTTTATVGVWSPAGDPATTDNVTIAHDWSAGWAAAGGLANAYAATLTIEDGGYLKITNALANFAGTMDIESGGNFEIDGDMTNWTGAIDVQAGAVFTSHYDFDAGDDAAGASLTVNGTLVLTADAPQGVLTLDLVVGGTGRIYARVITLNGNGATSGTTLPVELINFTAESNGNNNILNWATASEVNNSHFTIEKSENGKDFYEVGEVLGNGNSSDVNHYSFTDHNASISNTYYRLKQVDFDGSYSYSHIVNTKSQNRSVQIIQKENSSDFYIVTPYQDDFTIQAIDIHGKVLLNENFSGTEGARYNFNLQQKGFVIIRVLHNQDIVSKKSIIR